MRWTTGIRVLIGVALIIVSAAACTLDSSEITPAPTTIAQIPLRTPVTILPSITPMIGGQAPFATAVPFGVLVPTPLPANVGGLGAQSAATSASPGSTANNGVVIITATPVPGTITVPAGQIGNTIGGIFTQLVGLIGGFLGSSWTFVGTQGGWLLQLMCCILPFIVAIGYVLRRGRRIFR